jgi:precorrin-3B synthase
VIAAPQIQGWCPSAWQPMLTGDGYLMRLRFSCGIVSAEQAHAVAALAQHYGNGVIDLTRRANLQIRGVEEEKIAELQAELLAANLIAQYAEGETPNVIASPLAGRDRDALIDIRPLVQELEQCLAADPRARDLPVKFCMLIEDGGRFSLRDVGADIAFEAYLANGNICFVARIGGEIVGSVEAEEVPATALAFAGAFTSLRARNRRPLHRMQELVDDVGLPAILSSCPSVGRISTRSWGAHDNLDRRARPGDDAVGFVDSNVLGIAAPFGSLKADQLALLADLAHRHAASELRLTPWRAILIPGIASGAIPRVAAECARAGFITDPADPLRHVEACAGAPACASASVQTRGVAAALAPLLRPHDTLHVSGCTKRCASSTSASITLVGRDGCFDLIRNGRPGDTPALFGLSPEHARLAVQRIGAEDLVEDLARV